MLAMNVTKYMLVMNVTKHMVVIRIQNIIIIKITKQKLANKAIIITHVSQQNQPSKSAVNCDEKISRLCWIALLLMMLIMMLLMMMLIMTLMAILN